MENCLPVDPTRRNVDLEEIFGGPGVSFNPTDMNGPPAAEPMGIPVYMHTDEGGPLAVLGRYIRPPKGWMADYQAQSGVPMWTWWRNIEIGRREMDQFLSEPSYTLLPALFENTSKREREAVQLLMEAEGTPEWDRVLKMVGPRVEEIQKRLMGIYVDYFTRAGLTREDVSHLLTEVVPGIRQRGGDYVGWSRVKGPGKMGKMLERQLKTGEIPIQREMDAKILAKRVFRGVAEEKYLSPHYNMVWTQFQAFAPEMDKYVSEIFLRYLQQVRHQPDTLQQGMATAMSKMIDRLNASPLFKKLTRGSELSKEEYLDLVDTFVGFNYQLNLAWNPGAVIRQYMQTLQTTLPHAGLNDTMYGIKYALKWLKDENIQKLMEQRGVVNRDVMHEAFREIEDAMSRFQPGGLTGQAKQFIDYMRKNGTRYFKTGDDFNRVAAYATWTRHVEKHAKDFTGGGSNWEAFLKKSMVDTQDVKDGPFLSVIRQLLEKGDHEGATHEAALKFTQDTQFMYSRGNNPYFMQGTMGRFLGQYGTWPAQWTEYMRNMFMRGSYQNRMKAFGRWLGVNGAIMYGASQVFGIDMARWSFFAPMAYQGGPMVELGIQTGAVANVALGGSEDVVDKIQAARLAGNAVGQTALPIGQIKRNIRAVDSLSNAQYGDFLRTFLGFPKEE